MVLHVFARVHVCGVIGTLLRERIEVTVWPPAAVSGNSDEPPPPAPLHSRLLHYRAYLTPPHCTHTHLQIFLQPTAIRDPLNTELIHQSTQPDNQCKTPPKKQVL